jgi:Asp-tRNA(Asn)/Glu-tRNA(Gln) amidotransferase A subunit family amidase
LLGIKPEPVPADAPAPRIGFCRSPIWPQVDVPTQELVEGAARNLARAGADVRDVTLPASFDRMPQIHRAISGFEFTRNLAWEIENHSAAISEMLRNGRIKDGLACTFESYSEARELAAGCRKTLDDLYDGYDVLITAAATGEAPIGLEATGNAQPCVIWTTMHVPALSIPVFRGPNGLPTGLQVIGKRNEDRKLFAAARWIYGKLT